MSTWGEFQSLFQLSVGLNTAFAAFYDFLGGTPEQKAQEARRWSQRARTLKRDWTKLNQNHSQNAKIGIPKAVDSLVTSFILLEGDFKKILIDNDNINVSFLRWACLIGAATALVFLAISSFYYILPINLVFKIIAVIVYAPFVAGVLCVIFFSVKTLGKSSAMRLLQRQLESEEAAFIAKSAEEGTPTMAAQQERSA